MQFTPGQLVVHPHHGPATVADRKVRKVKGDDVAYITLQIHHQDLTISIPESKAEEVGVREVCDRVRLRRLLEIIQEPTTSEEQQWSRRMKANQEKIATGELERVAEVVRDLGRRRDSKGLSMAEKDLFRDAQSPLVAEVALALEVDQDRATEILELVATGTPLTEFGFSEENEDAALV